jgi:hypothetical protein
VVENPTESGTLSFFRGAEWKSRPGSSVQVDVQESLDTELDAYLDRELFVQPDPEVKPSPAAEKPAERLQSVLALAAQEEQWLRTLPAPEEPPAENSKDLESGECPLPEHLKPKPDSKVTLAPPVAPVLGEVPWTPLPTPLPGLAVVPTLAQPGWSPASVPVPVVTASSRAPWLMTGALIGVSAASLLVAGMLWHERERLPDRAQVMAAYAPAGTVTAVSPAPATPAPERVLSVKDSPLVRPPEPFLADWRNSAEGAVEALPGPVVPGRTSASNESPPPAPAPNPEPTVKAAPVKPRETPQPKRAAAVQERRDVEDPSLEDTEEEPPFMQQPVAASAPVVAKAEPQPAAEDESGEFDEFDKEFARQLGFTKDAVRKVPESKGVKSVWIPPDPAQDLPESLTPEDIQKVVVTNQPAITSCIHRHKDAIPGLKGGKFMMRWFIYPTGSTYGVALETQALRGTALATCIEGLAKDWKFPRHRTQMGPIRFPFVF